MAVQQFRVLQRHYDLLSGQVLKNHPNETGGFLGGLNGTVQLVLPVFNQSLKNKQSRFSIQSDDVHRAHELCAKHSLTYYGIYHNHPSGVTRPSFQDMNHVQRYLFILTLNYRNALIITAYRASGRQPVPVPVDIVPGIEWQVAENNEQPSEGYDELDLLNNQLNDIRNNSPQYNRYNSDDGSDDRNTGATFNTLA